jgi:hypothetical protein
VPARAALPACVVVALVIAVLLWQLQSVGDFRVDDAYITFAFSKNLAAGQGPVFGHDMRVEGYSNFLWMVVVGVLQLFTGDDVYGAARGAAFGCLGAALALAFRLARLHGTPRFAWLGVVLLAFATDLTRAAQSALETVPYAMALTLTSALYLYEPRDDRRASGYALLLLCLFRIDGVVHAAYFVGFELVRAFVERRLKLRTLGRWLLVPVVLYALYFGWRYAYYGLLLPAPYYAKAALGILDRQRGLDYVWAAAVDLGLPILLLGAAFAAGRTLSVAKVLLFGLVTSQLAYAAYVGGDWMPFNRFVVPVLPVLMVLFVWGVSDLVAAAEAVSRRALVAVAPFIVSTVTAVAVLQDAHSVNSVQEEGKLGSAAAIAEHTRTLVAARSLYKWMPRKPTETLVTDYGGVFGTFTNARIIEMWGLCNEEIALRGNTQGVNAIYGKTCIDCYEKWKPIYFHANQPMMRPVDDIKDFDALVNQVFQGGALDRVLDFRKNYVAGRVVNTRSKKAFYFLERRRPNVSFEARRPARNIVVEYVFPG